MISKVTVNEVSQSLSEYAAKDVLADGGFPLGRRRSLPLGRRVTLADCVSYLEHLELSETRVIGTMIWAWETWEGCNARAKRMREFAGG